MKVGVIIPAFNEAETIPHLIEHLLPLVNEVVVVDDGSTDNTAEEAKARGARALRHPRRMGKGAALRTGFQYAIREDFHAVITMDADGQHDWREIPEFIEADRNGEAGIIIGNRMGDVHSMPLIRLWTNRVTSWIISCLSHQRIEDSQSGYRLIRTDVLRDVKLVTSNFDTESEILVKASRQGYRIESIPIKTIYMNESSKIKPLLDTLRFTKLVLRSLSKRAL